MEFLSLLVKNFFSSKEDIRLFSQLTLLRHQYFYIFTLSVLKIMCKFAKLTKTHRVVNRILIPLSCSNQLQKRQRKIHFKLHNYWFRQTNRNIFSIFEQSQCLPWIPLVLPINRHWSRPHCFFTEIFLKPW